MSDAGSSLGVANVSLTFDDTGPPVPTAQITNDAVYHPTDLPPGDLFPAPAPGGPFGTNMSAFTNASPNGVWHLYVFDDASGDSGSIAMGWELNLTLGGVPGSCCGGASTLDHFSWDAIPGTQYVDSAFPVTVRAKNSADGPVTNFTGVVALSAWRGGQLHYSANFESGLQGFAINNGFGHSNGLWHWSNGRGADAGHSFSNSLYYGTGEGEGGGGNYDTGISEGVAVSPSIDLTGAGGTVTLTFNYLLQTEGQTNFDWALVEISTNNGAGYLLLTGTTQPNSAITNNTGGLWRQATVDLSAFADWPVRLRIHFDTVDGAVNNFEGWYVDDLAISSSLVAVPISPVASGNFIDGVWTGSISVPQAVTAVTLKADDGLAHTGTSNPFDVVVPSLRIARTGNDTVISWSTTFSELTLKSTPHLEMGTVWTAVSNTPVNVGGRLTVTNTLGGPQQFYRLEK